MDAVPGAMEKKSWVALSSLLAAIGITAFKIVVGLATGSLGILAEAAHSGLDLVAAAMTCLAIRTAGNPADRRHLFGHGKIENLSALFESLLLIVTCTLILYGAIRRMFFTSVEIEVSVWSFLVMITSIGVDYSRSRALRKAARTYNSQALEADALHFETDIWSSLAVIVGLICVKVGQMHPPWEFLVHGDAISALLVAGIAALVTIRLGMRTVDALIDSAPPGMEEQIKAVAEAVPGILDCHRIRVRTSGPQVFVDVHVTVDGGRPLAEAHDLTEQVEQAIQKTVANADVTVHAEPQAGALSS